MQKLRNKHQINHTKSQNLAPPIGDAAEVAGNSHVAFDSVQDPMPNIGGRLHLFQNNWERLTGTRLYQPGKDGVLLKNFREPETSSSCFHNRHQDDESVYGPSKEAKAEAPAASTTRKRKNPHKRSCQSNRLTCVYKRGYSPFPITRTVLGNRKNQGPSLGRMASKRQSRDGSTDRAFNVAQMDRTLGRQRLWSTECSNPHAIFRLLRPPIRLPYRRRPSDRRMVAGGVTAPYKCKGNTCARTRFTCSQFFGAYSCPGGQCGCKYICSTGRHTLNIPTRSCKTYPYNLHGEKNPARDLVGGQRTESRRFRKPQRYRRLRVEFVARKFQFYSKEYSNVGRGSLCIPGKTSMPNLRFDKERERRVRPRRDVDSMGHTGSMSNQPAYSSSRQNFNKIEKESCRAILVTLDWPGTIWFCRLANMSCVTGRTAFLPQLTLQKSPKKWPLIAWSICI